MKSVRPQRFRTLVTITLAVFAGGCASALSDPNRHGCSGDLVHDIDVLQAVLRPLTVSLGSKYLVVATESHALNIDRDWLELHLTTSLRRAAVPTLTQMLADYKFRNLRCHLPRNLEGVKLHYADAQDLDRMFSRDVLGGWKRFWVAYPGAEAMLDLSMPGYSTRKDRAIVTYFIARGSTAGEGMVVLLHNSAGSWFVEWSDILFET